MTSALRRDCPSAAPAVPGRTLTSRPGHRIVVRPAPRREPPFDDELEHGAAGPLDRPLPFPRRRSHLTLAPRPTAIAGGSDPAQWSRRLLIGISEAAAGRRPLTQLAPLLSPAVAHRLRQELVRPRHAGAHWTAAATVRSIRATNPADGVAELAATVRVGERVRAVALRLEVRHGRWCCTRLMLG